MWAHIQAFSSAQKHEPASIGAHVKEIFHCFPHFYAQGFTVNMQPHFWVSSTCSIGLLYLGFHCPFEIHSLSLSLTEASQEWLINT